MSDFLVDFRPAELRRVHQAADKLRFIPHIQVHVARTPEFDLAVSWPGSSEVWAPYSRPDGTAFVALAGRVALPTADWEIGAKTSGEGGLVCKAIDRMYAAHGVAALTELSGNFVILVWDGTAKTFHLVTDCTGVFPAFELQQAGSHLFGSHPDIVATAADQQNVLDETSLAEFALTGSVSPPFTYYRRIRFLGRSLVLSLKISDGKVEELGRGCYLPLVFRGPVSERETDAAEELAVLFRRAVARRSQPKLGRCAVALSGGLDSRAVLASVDPHANYFAFTCYDEENLEYRVARKLAQTAGAEFLPFPRSFDYYGSNAELGMRVAGGMGSLANNHFLGVLPWLREQGAQVLLTGCYCDYLFKALPLNRQINPLTGREKLGPYKHDFYFYQFWPDTALAREVRNRIEDRCPRPSGNETSDAAMFEIEQRRTFPLCYEADNAQRVIPQRLAGWFVPVSDPDLIRLYCRIPYRWKLNRSVFCKATARICGEALTRVPDANTGVPPGAGQFREAAAFFSLRLQNRLRRMRASRATNGSWPDWHYYVSHSPQIASLWDRQYPEAMDFFRRLLGPQRAKTELGSFQGNDIWLLVQLLSLKLWMEQRAR
jgi:asparagine synthase (glutamine-hydrolysing)